MPPQPLDQPATGPAEQVPPAEDAAEGTAASIAAELVQRVRAGEVGAWDELVAAYGGLALTVPRELGLESNDCDEVFQRTWISLWGHIRFLRQPAGLGAWIATTARHHATELLRQRRRLHERERRGARSETAPGPGPAREAGELEQRRLVEESVAELPERCRELIRRLDLSPTPASYDEVARDLGVPRGTLGPTRRRCLAQLARILERRGVR